jgi:hypothetical protein
MLSKNFFIKHWSQITRKEKFSAIFKMRFGDLHKGLSAQMIHIGPFSSEGPTIEKFNAYIKENGYEFDRFNPKTPRDIPE